MTTETTTQTKVKPLFYIFDKDETGVSQRFGAVFAHQKGKGVNIVLNGMRFIAFPPTDQSAAQA